MEDIIKRMPMKTRSMMMYSKIGKKKEMASKRGRELEDKDKMKEDGFVNHGKREWRGRKVVSEVIVHSFEPKEEKIQ